MSNLKTALDVFETDNGRYPTTSEGLSALVSCPPGLTTWQGPYAVLIPNDKWGHPYVYRCPGLANPSSFDLLSAGPDGILGTPDDPDNDEIP
jgi:general secretion pathway protein G